MNIFDWVCLCSEYLDYYGVVYEIFKILLEEEIFGVLLCLEKNLKIFLVFEVNFVGEIFVFEYVCRVFDIR